MSNFTEWAENELRLAGQFDPATEFYGGMMGRAVMKLVEAHAAEGHSGMSASVAAGLFNRLTKWQPLSPLTGADDEWNECGDGVFQNKRDSSVFKDKSGAYDSDGKVFEDPDGTCFTNLDSRVFVTFPYYPTTEYVKVAR